VAVTLSGPGPGRPASIGDLPDRPLHTIKTVGAQTGVPAVTLRAWERRYRVLRPRRTAGNYRLYSERDIALLRWLKSRVDAGLPISRAAEELKAFRQSNAWPAPAPAAPVSPVPAAAAPPAVYSQRLFAALTGLNEARAASLLLEATTLFDLSAVCLGIIQPCLVAIGEAWYRGEIRIATEHFASQYLRGRLLALFQAFPLRPRAPRIVVGCAPGEFHEIGSLMLALFLRRDGYRVDFLGADVNIGDLFEFVRVERPAMICLSASSHQTARELRTVQARLAGLRPRPKFGFGGRSFNLDLKLRASLPGLFLGEDAAAARAQARLLLPLS
jgi:DNA-binding transcriptional MerR regulator